MIINYLLQILCFTMAFISLVTFLLNCLKFSYAHVADNVATRILFFIIFLYVQIWNTMNTCLYFFNIFGTLILMLYLYDFVCNLASSCNRLNGKMKEILLAVLIITLIGIVWTIFFSSVK